MAAYRYRITGRVQGVGFRWFVARHARSLGLGGFARNLPDGSVEVVITGPDDAVEALEPLLRSGPAHAVVDGVERTPAEADPAARHSFDIL